MPGPAKSPLAYLGVKAPNPPNVIEANRLPRATDINYELGTMWISKTTDTAYVLCDVTAGVATWESIGGTETAPATYGTSATPLNETDEVFSADNNVVQVYATTTGGTDSTDYNAITGNISVTIGDGTDINTGVTGALTTAAGSDVLQVSGVYGYTTQSDGSQIVSTAAGTEGHLNLLETDAADLPQAYGFGVKGYLDAADTTAAPAAGVFAGVGSIVEYNTPFNGVAYGMAVSRLDAGAGAGTAGLAAFGVVQGTVAAADWLYGLDLYNGAAGVAYTTADIRLFNQSTIAAPAGSWIFDAAAAVDYRIIMGDAVGTNKVSFEDSGNNQVAAISSRGDIIARNINVTNTNIQSFNVSPILQSALTTGAAPTGATGDTNIMYCQDGVTMEQFILGAGQTIIAPRLADDGLLVSLDLTDNEGAEYYFGHTTRSKHAYEVGAAGAFFVEATIKAADCGGCDPVFIGFRKLGAPNADYTTYTDAGVIGLHSTTVADFAVVGSNLNGAGWAYVDTTDAWADGEAHTLRVDVSAAGVVTYLIDGVAPTVTQALTLDSGDTVIPFIHMLHGAVTPGAIHLQQLACGLA